MTSCLDACEVPNTQAAQEWETYIGWGLLHPHRCLLVINFLRGVQVGRRLFSILYFICFFTSVSIVSILSGVNHCIRWSLLNQVI